jgi:predicted ATPase with chaperone activity
MQNRKPRLPPSRGVLVILPLSLIEALDQAADALEMSRSDVIRRSLVRETSSALKEEVARAREAAHQRWRPKFWSV